MLLVTLLAFLTPLANTWKKLINTDTFAAVDDVGALAIANVFHNAEDAEIIGVMVDTPSKWGPLAISLKHILWNSKISVAVMKPITEVTLFDDALFLWVIGCSTEGGLWDEVTMVYVVTGLGEPFGFGNRNQKRIKLADGVPDTTVAAILNVVLL